MKTREGVPDNKKAFGPAKRPDTLWRLVRKDTNEECMSEGPTAFAAAAKKGWSMGELSYIAPYLNGHAK